MILIIDMTYKKDSLSYYEFVLPIMRIVKEKEDCEVKHFSEINEKLLESYDKIILSGTSLKDNEFRKYVSEFNWLKTIDKPVLGICAGMQMIGLIFGCELEEIKQIGMTNIKTINKTIKENNLFSGEFQAYELHRTCVKLNKEFDVLAESSECVQAIKHKEKDIYSIMFHPEVRNQDVIKKFIY